MVSRKMQYIIYIKRTLYCGLSTLNKLDFRSHFFMMSNSSLVALAQQTEQKMNFPGSTGQI